MNKLDLNGLLKGVQCSCGKTHECGISYVYIEPNAMARLEQLCADVEKILIVADENTYRVAGAQTESYISGRVCGRKIFPGNTVLIPNEEAIEGVEAVLGDAQLIIGIGSGVIQDLCKYISHYHKVPYYIVATAPSMDGYASTGAAMITGGMKVTYSVGLPTAILADTQVLKDAPMEMIRAGYGDIVGKYSALNDWKLGHVVNGEYFCQYIYDLVMEMLNKTLPLAQKLQQRDAESMQVLMEALIGVGIAMSFLGNSRPASGSEHHLSHYFEITGIVDDTPYLAHGIDVAFSTVVTCKIREKLLASAWPETGFALEPAQYESEIRRVYKSVADGCMALQAKVGHEREKGIYLFVCLCAYNYFLYKIILMAIASCYIFSQK